jgi:urea transporter
MQLYLDALLYSYAQIFFSNRRWLGALALVSTAIAPLVGVGGFIGGLICNGLAIGLRFDRHRIRSGFYGFNGILFGAASAYYFQFSPTYIAVALMFIVISFFAAAALEHYFASSFNLPGLSLPFILTLYVFIVFLHNFDWVALRPISSDASLLNFLPRAMRFYFQALGYVLFQPNALAGVLLAAGLLIFSRVFFVGSVIAYGVNWALAALLFPDASDAFLLQSSFNAILISLALGGSLIILSHKTVPLLILASAMSLIFTGFFSRLLSASGLPVLVLPFNVVALAAIYSLKFRQEQSDLVLLYFAPGSPEENYYYHQNRKSRFDRFRHLFPELPFFGEWSVSQGMEGDITHKGAWKHAWDFVILNDDGKEYAGQGTALQEYFCYNTPVVASLDGDVIRVIDNIPDNGIGEVNIEHNWGNTIILDHGQGLFSALSHLKPDSMEVGKGDHVHKGQTLARCGNSGRSPAPHLHFQFQLTDRVGEKTHQFPLAQYLERANGSVELRTFEYPQQGRRVHNIEIHGDVRRAFSFPVGAEYRFACDLNGRQFEERWEVRVDGLNNVFLDSTQGTTAYIYPRDKVFFMTNLLGKTRSALSFFFVNSISVPLGYSAQMRWKDELPVSVTIDRRLRFFSEFFLAFGSQFRTMAELSFEKHSQGGNGFAIHARFIKRGLGIFSWYFREARGRIDVDGDGEITSFEYHDSSTHFNALQKQKGSIA